MKKYNIMGHTMIELDDLKYAIRKLRRGVKDCTYKKRTEEQQALILGAYDDVVRQIFLEEIRAARTTDGINAILEMSGDFIVCKRNKIGSDSHEITYFAGWENGKADITCTPNMCMHFDYESKAEEICEQLGEGWRVCDTSFQAYEDNTRLLVALFRDDEEPGSDYTPHEDEDDREEDDEDDGLNCDF